MERQQVILILESLANGMDPATSAAIPHETFHSADTVRALFAATALLKDEAKRRPAVNPKFTSAGSPARSRAG